MHTTDPAGERDRRHRCLELDPKLTFADVGPIPPEQLRDALRLLATWASRGYTVRGARGGDSPRN